MDQDEDEQPRQQHAAAVAAQIGDAAQQSSAQHGRYFHSASSTVMPCGPARTPVCGHGRPWGRCAAERQPPSPFDQGVDVRDGETSEAEANAVEARDVTLRLHRRREEMQELDLKPRRRVPQRQRDVARLKPGDAHAPVHGQAVDNHVLFQLVQRSGK